MNKKVFIDEVAILSIYGVFASAIWGYIFSVCTQNIYNDWTSLQLIVIENIEHLFFRSNHCGFLKWMVSVLSMAHMLSIFFWYKTLVSLREGEKKFDTVLVSFAVVIVVNYNIYNLFLDKIIQNFFLVTVVVMLISFILMQLDQTPKNVPEIERMEEL